MSHRLTAMLAAATALLLLLTTVLGSVPILRDGECAAADSDVEGLGAAAAAGRTAAGEAGFTPVLQG
eukprot:CAMPEP_0172086186 /NCGR_PEP_ID=MMETSP1043-20130122/21973_1 /TAXON_ID=464988 /ORGANISM="Hemiselmis andersenii, Strain CCMP441" /LENGTH=66 /DNA_ID=CAMNT_0012748221 /DNA_START=21 /DNA_END=218 /DNA_ORIENTATION=-